jgi:hypothetical protein
MGVGFSIFIRFSQGLTKVRAGFWLPIVERRWVSAVVSILIFIHKPRRYSPLCPLAGEGRLVIAVACQ